MNSLNTINAAYEQTVGGIVTNDFRTARVFKKHGIDFCCGGKKTLSRACQDRGVSIETIQSEIAEVTKETDNSIRFDEYSLTELIDHIIDTHHVYLKDVMPVILEFAEKVARVHGPNNKSLVTVYEVVTDMKREMDEHLTKEEVVLFPYLKDLEKAHLKQAAKPLRTFGNITNPIQCLELEHESHGEQLYKLRELTNNYNAPMDACGTYRVLFSMLHELDEDIQSHVHLENNLLFPKGIILDMQFREKPVTGN